MKRLMFIILIAQLLVLPCLSKQADTDRELARTQEFIAATTKKGAAKISAMKAYIKKFPDTKKRWTKLAYYQLTVEYFQTGKYADAAKTGEKTISMGAPGDGEKGRLLLIVANSYAIKSAPCFNQEKAKKKVNEAVSFAKSKNLKDVLKEAKKLKAKLNTPTGPKITPEQKLKMHYSNEEFSEAIAVYKKMKPAEKSNPEIHKFYANSLFKSGKLDSALKEFQALYAKSKSGSVASRMGEIYARKARRNKSLLTKSIDFYIEAGLLYGKEGNKGNSKAAAKKAEFQLFEKYGFNAKIKKINREVQQAQSASAKNASAIRKLKYQIKKEERRIRKEYTRNDIQAPAYELKKIDDLKKKLRAMESGATPQTTDAAAKMEEERKKISDEFKKLVAAAKKRLGM